MNLRLAMISSYYPPQVGGISSHVQGIAQMLAQQGVEVHIITRQWDASAPAVTQEIETAGITVHRLATGKQRWRSSPAFVWKSANLVRALQPAVIHAHELLLPTSAALVAKRLTGLPLVVTVHSSGPDLGECARLQRTTLGARRVQYVRSTVDYFVAISSVVAADMAAIGIPAQKRVEIPNGVDMGRFQPIDPDAKAELHRQLGLPDGTVVVYTGRLSSEKRVLPLAQHWASIRQSYPDANLVVVGDGPEMPLLRNLQAPGVWLVGVQKDVLPYLQAADLFVLPSATEGLSISLLEALACGLPVVATKVGSNADLVVDSSIGRLVAPDNLPAFEQALASLLDQRTAWPAMGQAARRHVEQSYSLSSVACRLLQLYQKFTCPRGSPST